VHVADLRRPSSSSRALPHRFQDRREAGSRWTLRFTPSIHPRDRDCHHGAPCGSTSQQSGRLPSCLDRSGCPGRRPHERFLDRMRYAVPHTVFTSEPPPRVSARWCGVLLGQRRVADLPCGSSCVATRDASDRLLPTHVLRTSTRASSVPDASCACAPARSRESPASHQSDSLRWVTHLSCRHRGGRCLPVAMRVIRTSGISVASPMGARSLARPAHPWEPPRPPSTRSRERASRTGDPRCLPSSKNLCPATPFRASGSGVPRFRGLATATPVLDAFSPPGDPCGALGGRVPVHAPRCQRESRFSGPRRRLPTSAT